MYAIRSYYEVNGGVRDGIEGQIRELQDQLLLATYAYAFQIYFDFSGFV